MSTAVIMSGEETLPSSVAVDVPVVVPEQPHRQILKRSEIANNGVGTKGKTLSLLSNHFNVVLNRPDTIFSKYNVSIKSEDGKSIEGKWMSRKVIDKLMQTYSSELACKEFAYDGGKCLFTIGPLSQNKFEFTVILEECSYRDAGASPINGRQDGHSRKRLKQSQRTRQFIVAIDYARKIPIKSISVELEGVKSQHSHDALSVLDVILRQQQAKRGCLLVRQSFFDGDCKSFVDLGGGVTGCRGFHTSFCVAQNGLSLVIDSSTTMIVTPGPVIDFLLTNQNVKERRQIDWTRARKMLKNLRIKAKHNNMEFKITGISDRPCFQQMFQMKVRNSTGEDKIIELTVLDYFKSKNIELSLSDLPCLDVGKPNRPCYLPVELCDMVSLQRYVKALSSQQRASLMEKSRQKPQDRMRFITDVFENNKYDNDPTLTSCGVHVEKQLKRVNGRVLSPPTLIVGNNEESVPSRGRWNFNSKKLWQPTTIDRWAMVNFSAKCDMSQISRDLINCGRSKGIHIERPFALIEEDRHSARAAPVLRVEKLFEKVRANLPGPPDFLLCILPDKKNSELYGPWKKKNLHEMGIVTQCIVPSNKMNDKYFANVLLKINAKLGGLNSLLTIEQKNLVPVVSEVPTLILGIDVSHGCSGCSDMPSIAAVVGSRHWPQISRYRASVRAQPPKVEMIESLYKPQDNGTDDGIIRELLLDFYQTSSQRKPSQIIIFRDGVSEPQFNQVLNVEVNQIMKAYEHLGEVKPPKFTVIIAQKMHRTKLFLPDSPENVPPGTVVDAGIVHPSNYDFFMCAQSGQLGTSRPIHYHVLLDEIGFTPDILQELVHALSYVYQRSMSAVSIVAPIRYAHLAAQQVSQFIKFDDLCDSAGSGGTVPELPRLHKDVCSSMFFC